MPLDDHFVSILQKNPGLAIGREGGLMIHCHPDDDFCFLMQHQGPVKAQVSGYGQNHKILQSKLRYVPLQSQLQNYYKYYDMKAFIDNI